VCAVDFAHPARADLRQDLVGAKFIACGERHLCGLVKFTRSDGGLVLRRLTGHRGCRPY
jgi:hypothetical protein